MDGERLAGSIFTYNWQGEKDYVKIMNIAVHPDYRKQGYATAAMAQACKIAADRDYKIIQDQVRIDNKPSIALHEKCGFETDGYIFLNQKQKEVCLYIYPLT